VRDTPSTGAARLFRSTKSSASSASIDGRLVVGDHTGCTARPEAARSARSAAGARARIRPLKPRLGRVADGSHFASREVAVIGAPNLGEVRARRPRSPDRVSQLGRPDSRAASAGGSGRPTAPA
jgi:hypothetical protein